MRTRRAYRFETLLKLRRAREEGAKRVVATRLRAIGAVQQRRAALSERIVQESEAIRASLMEKNLDVEQLRWSRHWLSRLRLGVLEAEAEVAGHRAMLAQERSALSDAMKHRKVLDRLKDRWHGSVIAGLNRAEAQAQDESNTARFVAAVADEMRT
jgi:flagellar export protein FliJ